MIEKALEYAERGWKVFPLAPRSKVPMSTECTFHHATDEVATVATWWAHQPAANIAIQPASSGLLILDVDPKNDGHTTLARLIQEHGPLITRKVVTGSGGEHYYFKHPEWEVRNRLGFEPGLDILAATGYVVAPPSIHPNGRPYAWANPHEDIEQAPEWLLEYVRPRQPTPPALAMARPAVPDGTRGKLATATHDFFREGAPQGMWNTTLHKCAKDCQQNNMSKQEYIERATAITGHLDSTDMRTIDSAFSTPPRHAPRLDPHDALRQRILKCHLIQDLADSTNARFVDLSNGHVHLMDVDLAKKRMGGDAWKEYERDHVLDAEYVYDPRLAAPLAMTADGVHIYNTYIPPEWKASHHYQKVPLTAAPMPDVYAAFFSHLTDTDAASLTYLLDWLALSLQGRNMTILTAIGEQGVGKGVLGEIMERMHGAANFAKVRDQVFKAHFNAPLKNRTLVYVDEADLRTKDAQDRIKDTVNDYIEIEEKGKDALSTRNYASFYLSSNSFDAVRIEAGDRRFSIIQLTNTPLKDTPLISRVTELLSSDNVAQLARHLYHRMVSPQAMLAPFKSKRTEEVKEASLTDWEDYVLNEWTAQNTGRRIKLRDVQQSICDACNLRTPPGRIKLEGLAKRYPDMVRVVRPNAQAGDRYLEALASKALPTMSAITTIQ